MKHLLSSLAMAAGLMLGAAPAQAGDAAGPFRPAGRGGRLLPAGWLSTRGSRIVDEAGNVVRIASVGWYGTDGPAGHALQGLWAVSYRAICDSIAAAGFNTVRIPWSDVNLDARPASRNETGTIDYSANRDLRSLTTWRSSARSWTMPGRSA